MVITKNLESHPLYPIGDITGWQSASKTKPIKAKPIQSLLSDEDVLTKFLLAALEGNQTLKANAIVCLGAAGDVWQQAPDRLLKKYKVTGFDENGWLICEPLPEHEVDCFETELHTEPPGFSLKAKWGERQADGSFILFGEWGDFIVRDKNDHNDVWIVQKSLFLSTYEIKK
jgi:hypothetical protein